MTIIRSSPRLFKDVSRRARIEQRPRGNTPGYIARAIGIGGLAARSALGNGDTGNPRFHLDACFQNVLKRPAATRRDAARKLFGFKRQGHCQKILRECLGKSALSIYLLRARATIITARNGGGFTRLR
jgi:hypothetical protein